MVAVDELSLECGRNAISVALRACTLSAVTFWISEDLRYEFLC